MKMIKISLFSKLNAIDEYYSLKKDDERLAWLLEMNVFISRVLHLFSFYNLLFAEM
jgi:hypothetical protein